MICVHVCPVAALQRVKCHSFSNFLLLEKILKSRKCWQASRGKQRTAVAGGRRQVKHKFKSCSCCLFRVKAGWKVEGKWKNLKSSIFGTGHKLHTLSHIYTHKLYDTRHTSLWRLLTALPHFTHNLPQIYTTTWCFWSGSKARCLHFENEDKK